MIWNGLNIDYDVDPGLIGDMVAHYDAAVSFSIEGIFDIQEFVAWLEENDRSDVEVAAALRGHVSSRSASWIHREWDYEVLEAAQQDYENWIAYARDESVGV